MEETQACCSQWEGQREGAEEERNGGTVVGEINRTEEVKATYFLYQSPVNWEKVAEIGRTEEVKSTVPWFGLSRPPVDWEQACKLKHDQYKYIDYKGLIMHERTPALFPEGCKGAGLCVVSIHLSTMGFS